MHQVERWSGKKEKIKRIVLEGVRLGLYTVVLLAAIPKPVE